MLNGIQYCCARSEKSQLLVDQFWNPNQLMLTIEFFFCFQLQATEIQSFKGGERGIC